MTLLNKREMAAERSRRWALNAVLTPIPQNPIIFIGACNSSLAVAAPFPLRLLLRPTYMTTAPRRDSGGCNTLRGKKSGLSKAGCKAPATRELQMPKRDFVPDTPEELRRARIRRRRDVETEKLKALAARRAALPREDPHPGFWLVRLVKGGPEVAACLRVIETVAEPDNPENDMTGTRSPHLAAFVLDQPVPLERVWDWRGEPITEAEYRHQCASAEWARLFSPQEPIANPFRKVDLTRLPIPFVEDN